MRQFVFNVSVADSGPFPMSLVSVSRVTVLDCEKDTFSGVGRHGFKLNVLLLIMYFSVA